MYMGFCIINPKTAKFLKKYDFFIKSKSLFLNFFIQSYKNCRRENYQQGYCINL